MKRVLVAPLDWGLGHTARCIPVIQEFIKTGSVVYFAGNKNQQDFVKQHNLNIKTLDLFGYDVSYSSIFPQWVKVGFQSLRLKKIIDKENKWLEKVIEDHGIDTVISDNRFGLYNSKVHCVFITHQLNIPSPIFSRNINNINTDFIGRFDQCWVPDNESLLLSGELSLKSRLSIPVKRIGLLSRFNSAKNESSPNFHVLLLLSGVEPQRSMLEQKLIGHFQKTNYRVALVRGTAGELADLPKNIVQFGLLNTDELKKITAQSEVVICRSGYSSIMDLVSLNKKMILVPTPGQPEQEYLAEYLNKKFGIPFIEQNNLKQAIDLANAKAIEFPFGIKNENLLKEAVSMLPNNK